MKNKKENGRYKVIEFGDKNGKVLDHLTPETTFALVAATNGFAKGICFPLEISVIKSLNLKVGDTFTRTTIYEKVEK